MTINYSRSPQTLIEQKLISQDLLSPQAVAKTQNPLGGNLLLMVSVIWLPPLILLLTVKLAKTLHHKYRFHQEFTRLNRVANLERVLKIKTKGKF